MRKFIVGFVAGILIASSFPVYGAVSSMVGKEVQAENAVIVNGQELEVKSVNIDGTTYTPNRALAEALGMSIIFDNNTVIFDEREVTTVNEPEVTEQPSPIPSDNQTELDQINARLSEIYLAEREYLTKITQFAGENIVNPDRREEIQKESAELNEEMTNLIEEKKQLEARRTELQSQQNH